jgi:threonyl-tRNA synthetase
MEWEPKTKAIKDAEEVEKQKMRSEEALVVFTSVEKTDEKNPAQAAKNAVAEILKVFDQVKAKNIVVYPFVHLSSSPSSPTVALQVLCEIEGKLKEKNMPVKRAPFGWYKGFDIKCKGHPLSELSKQIAVEKAEETSVEKEKELKSDWFIIDPSGKMNQLSIKDGKISGFDFSKNKKLQKFAQYEMVKSRISKEEPPHMRLMRKLQLVDYEEASDPGHFRFLPAGKLVKSLIEDWVTRKVAEYGAMEVETPIMYDYEHPVLKSYMQRFPARQYAIETPNKKVFLRFAACFGQFLLLRNANLSYRNLPVRIYEMASSFRVEQRGELAGLRRLRKFTMPDCHAICADVEQAKEEMLERFDLAMNIQKGFELSPKEDLELAIRVVKEFYDQNKDYVLKMVKKWGKPAIIEIWDKRFFYFVLKYEFNFVDAIDKAAALTTDQIDIENGERYGMQYTDKDNTRKHPVILHLSPSGATERVIYALLEKASMEQQAGKNPVLPLWLSPVQVRLCPVSDKFLPFAEKLADELTSKCIRVDIDDRVESVQKKIRDAEVDWVPRIVVLGEREEASGKLAVRFRETGKVEQLSAEDLASDILKKTSDKPFRPLSLPRYLTKRPTFIG